MNDFKFDIRQLRKKPGFTTVATLTLALGIGATSVVFSLIQGVLLTPPPYPKPEQISDVPFRCRANRPGYLHHDDASFLRRCPARVLRARPPRGSNRPDGSVEV